MNLHSRILGCLLGTAVGDAVGLRREGLSRRRAMRMYGSPPLEPLLIWGRGFCSDDTEHTQLVGWALARSAGEPNQFERLLATGLRKWLLTCPAGIGLATLRACGKLLLGIGPSRSGVFSAGNGPAMRCSLLGVCAGGDEQLKQLVHKSTRITHTDPRAEEGALLVARAAGFWKTPESRTPTQFIHAAAASVAGAELRDALDAAAQALKAGWSCLEFADSQGWSNGIKGYVNHTVPAAIYCWARWPNDFRRCVESAVMLGGDTDTIGAIAGGICGANLGAEAIPESWIKRLVEWPRTTAWMHQLAGAITEVIETRNDSNVPPMHWPATLPRNLAFTSLVVLLALRRLLPPY